MVDSLKDTIKRVANKQDDAALDDDVMLNPEYLRKSSNIISDALQKGFDVLQLENGDIVTTGTKVVVTQYRWDPDKDEMVKLSAKERKEEEKKNKKAKK